MRLIMNQAYPLTTLMLSTVIEYNIDMDNFFEDMLPNDDTKATLAASSKRASKGATTEGQLTVDVFQTDNDIVIQSTVAGVTSQDIDIAITNDMVTIKGKRESAGSVKTSNYYYQELYWGPFSRSIILPEEIDSDKASASMKNGILTVRLPKLAKSKIKKLTIAS